MRLDLASISALAERDTCVVVTVVATFGSTPREVGARMLVTQGGLHGSIGGGQLEFQEIDVARGVLAADEAPWRRVHRRIILGPDAGQCCGGIVEVLHERIGWKEARVLGEIAAVQGGVQRPCVSGVVPDGQRAGSAIDIVGVDKERHVHEPWEWRGVPLTIYGAGHVARALVPIVVALPFDVTWVDVAAARFPERVPDGVTRIVTDDPTVRAATAGAGSSHLVMTHDHDLDADICRTLLARNALAFVGLIGSATKRARFVQRFLREGLSEAAVARLVCPIGSPDVPGKEPMAIAVATAAQLLARPDIFISSRSGDRA